MAKDHDKTLPLLERRPMALDGTPRSTTNRCS